MDNQTAASKAAAALGRIKTAKKTAAARKNLEKARKTLTPEERKEKARKAAAARWNQSAGKGTAPDKPHGRGTRPPTHEEKKSPH